MNLRTRTIVKIYLLLNFTNRIYSFSFLDNTVFAIVKLEIWWFLMFSALNLWSYTKYRLIYQFLAKNAAGPPAICKYNNLRRLNCWRYTLF